MSLTVRRHPGYSLPATPSASPFRALTGPRRRIRLDHFPCVVPRGEGEIFDQAYAGPFGQSTLHHDLPPTVSFIWPMEGNISFVEMSFMTATE